MKTRIVTPALLGAAALLCSAAGYANVAPVDTASVTNANPALPRPAADPTTTADSAPAAAAASADDIGDDAESPPPGSSAAPKPSAAAASPPPAAGGSTETAQAGDAAQNDSRAAVKPKPDWWASTAGNDRFGVKYVAQPAGQPALLIHFTRDVSGDAATQGIKLIDSNGKPVEAAWQQGSDPRTVIASNLKPGRYTVVLESQLASAAGEPLGQELRGKTRIR